MKFGRGPRMITLLVIDTAFFFLELGVGFATHSLALVADSFHMLNDIISLIIAFWALRFATKPASRIGYTYGWQRAEILGALVNGVFLIALCLSIFIEALQRMIEPPIIKNPKLVLIVGSCGLASNFVGMWLFHSHSHGTAEPVSDIERHGVETDEGTDAEASIGPSLPLTIDPGNDLDSVMPRTVVEQYAQLSRSWSQRHVRGISEDLGSSHPRRSRHSLSFSNPMRPRLSADEQREQRMSGDADAEEYDALLSSFHDHSGHKHNHSSTTSDKGKSGHSHGNLNMRGVFLHVLGDALGNIGVISAALFIWQTTFSWRYYFDPVVSLLIACIILASAVPLCRQAALILLQVAPHTIDVAEITEDILAIKGVLSVHDMHVWQLSDTKMVATVHVMVNLPADAGEAYMNLTASICECLRAYGIYSCTIQPEFSNIVPVSENGRSILKRLDTDQLKYNGFKVDSCLMDKIDAAHKSERCCANKAST